MPDALTNEWAELVEQWNVEEPSVHLGALRARIDAERRRMTLWVAADVAVTVIAAGGAAYAALRYTSDWSRLLALNVAIMSAAAWAFALWNRRGTWRPLGESTESFLRLARLRCQRKLQALRFGTGVLVVQLVTVAAWRAWGPHDAPFARADTLMTLPVMVVVGFVGALVRSRRRVSEELAELDRLEAQLADWPPADRHG